MMRDNLKEENRKKLKYLLINSKLYFIQLNGSSSFSKGWKLSIQGKTLEDAMYIYDNLIDVFEETNSTFKIGTQRLIDYKHPQQSTKLMTIYIPDDINVDHFASIIKEKLVDYDVSDIKPPLSYETYSQKHGIYYRNDRDKNGNYISAN